MSVPASVEQWRSLAAKWGAVYALEPNEILAIIWSESFGDENAVNPSDPSWGLMQVTALIGREFAQTDDPAALKVPDTNVRAGAGFLGYLKRRYAERFPDYAWVAMYNAGEPAVIKGFADTPYVTNFLNHLTALNAVTPPPSATP